MNSPNSLLRTMRRVLADQERALRAASLAESSRATAPELRAMYTRHVDPPESPPAARVDDHDLIVSTGARLTAM